VPKSSPFRSRFSIAASKALLSPARSAHPGFTAAAPAGLLFPLWALDSMHLAKADPFPVLNLVAIGLLLARLGVPGAMRDLFSGRSNFGFRSLLKLRP
jgi:hypothetical protein